MRNFNLLTILYFIICYENVSIIESLSTSKLSLSPLTNAPLFQLHKSKFQRHNNALVSVTATSSGRPHSVSYHDLLSKSPLYNTSKNDNAWNRRSFTLYEAVTSSVSEPTDIQSKDIDKELSKKTMRAELRKEGGLFSFKTPVGALNLYGVFYGLTAISLGFVWYMLTMMWKLIHKISGNRFDKMCRIPIFIAHCWGRALMKLTFADPKIVNREILENFYKTNRSAMIVANHNSWQDIPYLGTTIGWRNYKIIAKKELLKVPILGNGISTGGHVVIDRTNRRSQVMTLKSGIEWLKNGVCLCAFPEGTRSKTGKLQPFKNGAFKMAHKAGAPVIPLSICGAAKVQPSNWMFPLKRGYDVKVVVHEPVESVGRTEAELAEIVREKIISGLPEDQKP